MPTVEFICLANSTKHGEHCVAGLRTDGEGWIRPVGVRADGALTAREIACDDGSLPVVLDVLGVDLAAPAPQCHQPENWTCSRSATQRWRKIRTANAADMRLLDRCLKCGPTLVGGTAKGVDYAGLQRSPIGESLALVEPENLHWLVERWKEEEPLQAKAAFMLAGQRYWLWVTDPTWKDRIVSLGEGEHPTSRLGVDLAFHRVLLTISLGEPFARAGEPRQCWKLVAGVVVVPRSRGSELESEHRQQELGDGRAEHDWTHGPGNHDAVVEPDQASRRPWTILEDRKLVSLFRDRKSVV